MGRLIEASMLKEKILVAEIKKKGALSGTEVYNVIDNTPTCTTEWIPVSERLPEGKEFELKIDEKTLYQKVLVQTTNFNMYTAHYDRAAWFDDEGNTLDVLYWMPLPKLYRPYSTAEGRGKR